LTWCEVVEPVGDVAPQRLVVTGGTSNLQGPEFVREKGSQGLGILLVGLLAGPFGASGALAVMGVVGALLAAAAGGAWARARRIDDHSGE